MAEERRNDRPRSRRAKRKVCSFCVDKVDHIDYKDVAKLRRYVTERAKILPRRISGLLRKASETAHGCDQESETDRTAALYF